MCLKSNNNEWFYKSLLNKFVLHPCDTSVKKKIDEITVLKIDYDTIL